MSIPTWAAGTLGSLREAVGPGPPPERLAEGNGGPGSSIRESFLEEGAVGQALGAPGRGEARASGRGCSVDRAWRGTGLWHVGRVCGGGCGRGDKKRE